jgi:hypothetical protein
VLFQSREVSNFQQLDGLQSDLFAGLAEFFQRDAAVAPFADRMIDPVLELGTECLVSCLEPMRQTGGRGDSHGASGDLPKSRATGHGIFHDVKGLGIKDWIKEAPTAHPGPIANLNHDALLVPKSSVVDT